LLPRTKKARPQDFKARTPRTLDLYFGQQPVGRQDGGESATAIPFDAPHTVNLPWLPLGLQEIFDPHARNPERTCLRAADTPAAAMASMPLS
jgi:hypothetical protein